MTKAKTLLVIVTDRLSDFITRGSLVEKYYNPGDYFDDVHLLLLNDDTPDASGAQKAVGTATVHIHNLPINTKSVMVKTFGWRPWLMRKYISPVVELAKEIQPNIIRCHGGLFGGFIASQIKEKCGIPYVISLHCTKYDEKQNIKQHILMTLVRWLAHSMRMCGFRNADRLMPAYDAITHELKEYGLKNYEIYYNIINSTNLKKKDNYALHSPVQLVSVGRQISSKDPSNIIHSVARIPDIHLTLIGKGECHESLQRMVAENKWEDKVLFIPECPIETICEKLKESDIFIVRNDYWGISRAALEAALTGIPIIHSRSPHGNVKEFDDCGSIVQVENTVDAYEEALKKLINDNELRKELGEKTYTYAHENWSPEQSEARVVELYKRVMSNGENT